MTSQQLLAWTLGFTLLGSAALAPGSLRAAVTDDGTERVTPIEVVVRGGMARDQRLADLGQEVALVCRAHSTDPTRARLAVQVLGTLERELQDVAIEAVGLSQVLHEPREVGRTRARAIYREARRRWIAEAASFHDLQLDRRSRGAIEAGRLRLIQAKRSMDGLVNRAPAVIEQNTPSREERRQTVRHLELTVAQGETLQKLAAQARRCGNAAAGLGDGTQVASQ